MRPFGFLFKERKELYWSVSVSWSVLSFDFWEWMKRRSDILFFSSSDSHPSFDLRANSANFLRLIHPFDDPENARQMHRAAWTHCRGLQAQRGWPLKVSNWAKRKWRECVKLTLLTLWNSQSGIVSVFETPAAIAGTRLKGSGFEFNNLWWSHAPVTISHLPLLLPIYPDLTPLSTLRLQTTAFYSYHTWCFFCFLLNLGVSFLLCSSFFTQQFLLVAIRCACD